MVTQKIFSKSKQRRFSVLQTLQAIFFAGVILYFGRILFIPVFYGLFIAMVLYPVCRYLEQKGWPQSLAIMLCLLIVTIFITLLFLLLVLELKAFTQDLPELQTKLAQSVEQLQKWLEEKFDISIAAQAKWIDNAPLALKDNVTQLLQGTLQATLDTLFMLFMIPVYTALFLANRGMFTRFVLQLLGEKYNSQLRIILHKAIHTYHNYVKSMVLVYVIVGILNSIGLLALGVKHALLFGMLAAIMTVIPYIGIVASALLPVSLAWITTGSVWTPLAIIGVFVFVQYLEANVIFPKVVGAQLNVNTWATLVSIIAGGIIWGVSGMILFIPFLAILKITSDYVEAWKPLQTLLSRKP
jgi:predicted PurR-regulated permease PerM